MATILAQCAGDILAEDGSRLIFVRRGSAPTIARFVFALLVVILGGNAVVQVALGMSYAAAAILGALAVVAVVGFRYAHRAARAARDQPIGETRPIVVLDQSLRMLLDGDGNELAPLDAVSFHPVFQVGSSSRALACHWPKGRAVVYRGNPLDGGSIAAAQEVLRARGFKA